MKIKQILRNSTFTPVLDCISIRDSRGKHIGHIDGEVYLDPGYALAYEVWCKLVENGVYANIICP